MDIENYFKNNIIVSPGGRESLSIEKNCKLFNYIIDNNIDVSNEFYNELKKFFSKVEFKDKIEDLSSFQTHQNGLTIEKSVVDTFPEYFNYIGDPIMHSYISTGKGYALADLEVIKDFSIEYQDSTTNKIYSIIIKTGEHVDIKSHLYYYNENEPGYYDMTGDLNRLVSKSAHESKCNYLFEYIINENCWYLVRNARNINNQNYHGKLVNFKTDLDPNNLFRFRDNNNQLIISHLN